MGITVCDAPRKSEQGTSRQSRRPKESCRAAREVLLSGKAIRLDHHEQTATGAYSDPYICAYYPLHYLRIDLVKAGVFRKEQLAIKTKKLPNDQFDARMFLVNK